MAFGNDHHNQYEFYEPPPTMSHCPASANLEAAFGGYFNAEYIVPGDVDENLKPLVTLSQ